MRSSQTLLPQGRSVCVQWGREGSNLQVSPPQAPPSGLSDASKGMAKNTPVIPIVPVTGAAPSKFREMGNSPTPQKNGIVHSQTISSLAEAPKVRSSAVQRQGKCCYGTSCLGLGHLDHLQWSSMEGEAIKKRGLQSLGGVTW